MPSDESILDREVACEQVLQLSRPDAIAAFFAHLGYNIEGRIPQTPANLGITTDSVARAIRRIELVADQGGELQVYLFELASVTVAATQGIARAFRSRTGNYLLVLTSDYDRLDFVLLERTLPHKEAEGIGQRHASIQPRSLSVDRRNPDSRHLRVLRRLSYTESDPFLQYEKLRSAYDVAFWSEEFFDNRALFSDYFLLHRLPEDPAWQDDPVAAYRQLRGLYAEAHARWPGQPEAEVRKNLLLPALGILGFRCEERKSPTSDTIEPDFHLLAPDGSTPLAACSVYTWGRSLDGPDYQRDSETRDENPGAVAVSLLERGDAPWAVVTNGKQWRLYARRAHNKATNYYEIDLEETLARNDPKESFRYFWHIFRRQAFEPVLAPPADGKGEPKPVCFLDRLFEGSQEYAKKLGERLKERVFGQVFPHFAEGFVEHVCATRGIKRSEVPQEELDAVFQGTLTFLYRLLFLLYAEARDLLPIREYHGYFQKSLTRLKREIENALGTTKDAIPTALKNRFRADSYALYDRFAELSAIIDKGDSTRNVPVYNGGLFLSDPPADDQTPEATSARFLRAHKIADRDLALGLDLLARDEDDKTYALVPIDYKSLGVRQLGSIYEGLLEFKVRVARERLAIMKVKEKEVYKPARQLTAEEREKWERALAREERQKDLFAGPAIGCVVKENQVYLENDKRERKATGSYYTPDHIVEYIVENAVGPVLSEKFEAMRPALREAQKERRRILDRRAKLLKEGLTPREEHDPNTVGVELVDQLFDFRVLDPAMGSGHFLVEAVDFITDKTLDFLNAFPWNPVIASLDRARRTILDQMDAQGITIEARRLTDVNLLKRHVLKRCIYGVDLNPMAVELAKVSLWLDCFTLGAPLSFLDHHFKCGNSLIGSSLAELEKASQGWLFPLNKEPIYRALRNMLAIGQRADTTILEVTESRQFFAQAQKQLETFNVALDCLIADHFGVEGARTLVIEHGKDIDFGSLAHTLDTLDRPRRKILEAVRSAAQARRFFHWDMAFPEAFFEVAEEIKRKPSPGFDAIVGNPPYDVLAEKELGYDISQETAYFRAVPLYAPAIRGKGNLYKLFVCRGVGLMGQSGRFSHIVPMMLLGDDQSAGVRRLLLQNTGLALLEAFPQKDDPKNRVFPEAKLATCIFVTGAAATRGAFSVRTHPGRSIVESSPVLRISPADVLRFDPGNGAIPSCTQRDWDTAIHLLSMPGMGRMGEMAASFQGEVNETNERAKGTLSDDPHSPLALRGANVCLYVIREASQGEDVRLDVPRFLEGKREDAKANAHRHQRIGFQRSSPQNNFRRIIAARIPSGEFCLDTVSYVTDDSTKLDLDLLLALLNSEVLDWYFRLGSTNSKVNEYQFDALPLPSLSSGDPEDRWKPLAKKGKWGELAGVLCGACDKPGVMPNWVAEALAEMSRRIQEIESKRVLKSRSERSHLAPESQPIQEAIDTVLFRCYGLSDDDARYVEARLKEML